jgi:AbiJ N-terminal domain 3/Abortive infection C-terminus
MTISELTRRDILDELRLRNTRWYGRLDEIEFLSRLYPLASLPSYDGRFKDMEGDIWQHRVNNNDWDDWWVFDDPRLELAADDKRFLNFLVEMLHPVVRSDDAEVAALLELFNRRLVHDGWKIIERERLSGHPVFVAISSEVDIQVQDEERIGSEYAVSQLKKCDEKIGAGDHDGAISAARSLVESTLADLYNKMTGDTILRGGSLMDSYKVVRNLLNLSDDKFANEAIKNILRSLSTMVEGLDNLSNMMGDRHIRPAKPQRHHARLCVNAAKTLVNFLYDTLDARSAGTADLYEQLVRTLDSDIRFLPRDELLDDGGVHSIFARTDPNIRNVLKKRFIEEYAIDSFRQSDIFLAALRIFQDELQPSDVRIFFEKHKGNDQACGLKGFLREMEAFKPSLISSSEIRTYLRS